MADSSSTTFKAEQAALRKEYLGIIASHESNPDYWLSYYDKRAGHFARLTNGDIVVIEKPSIETSFCFGESGYDYDEAGRMADYASKSEEYFKRENLADLQRWIDRLDGSSTDPVDIVVDSDFPGISRVRWCYHHDRISKGLTLISDADRAIMLSAYRAAYAAFEKRLNAYLKRYGMSKVHTWTYWRDA